MIMPLGWQRLLVKSMATDCHTPQASGWLFQPGYFSQAVWLEMMAPVSAKPKQFSSPLCYFFPAVSIKSYIATNYALNIQFAPFCKPGIISSTCANVLMS